MEPTVLQQSGDMLPSWLWGYFIPIGLLLLVWGGLSPRKARRVTPIAATAIALAIFGYWAVGFALHMGGAQAIHPDDSSLQGLQALFSMVPSDPGWGIIGLAGFFLADRQASSSMTSLFLTYLPLIATSVLMVTLALAQTRRWMMIIAGALTGSIIVPIAACWVWGSGWLSHLGQTLGLGFGFVDFGGTTLILWLPGMIVLPILLLQSRHPTTDEPIAPPTYAPLMANVGALLMGLGWAGWALSQPFHIGGAVLDWPRSALNMLLAMAGAVVTSQLYAWLVTGQPETLLASQGLGAGWGAILGCAPFLPSWGALLCGLLAGLAYPLIRYLVDSRLRIRDASAAVALALTSGSIGLVAITLLADGRWGQGWNRHGITADGVVTGPGVAGIFVSGTLGQLSAQVAGLIAIGVWGLMWGGILGVIMSPRVLGQVGHPNTQSKTTEDD